MTTSKPTEDSTTTTTTTTTTLSPTQELVVQAMMAEIGQSTSTTTTTTTTSTTTSTTSTPSPSIQTLIQTGSLTVTALEQFLSSTCTWCYSGGFAAIVWARSQGGTQVPTTDLDIFIDASQIGTVRHLMYGDDPSGSAMADGYKVTLHSASGGMLDTRVQVDGSWVVPKERLQLNYGSSRAGGLGALITSRPKLKDTASTLQGISERDNSVSQQVDAEKAKKREERAAALEALGSKEKKDKEPEKGGDNQG